MKKKKSGKTVILSSVLVMLIGQGDALGACFSSLISITASVSPLAFASIAPCTTAAANVTLDGKNSTISVSPAGCLSTFGTGVAAVVNVMPNQAKNNDKVLVSITSPTFTMKAGGNSMSVTGWDFTSKGGGPAISIQGAANKTIAIGSILKVGANQASGSYSGTFTVSATCAP